MLDSHVLPHMGRDGFSCLTWDPFRSRITPPCFNSAVTRWIPPTGSSSADLRWAALCGRPRFLCVKALDSSDRDGRNGNNGVDGWDPSFEIEVPADQRPANELAALKEEALYSWAQLSWVDFGVRLGGLWLMFFVFLGGPIASASFEPTRIMLNSFLAVDTWEAWLSTKSFSSSHSVALPLFSPVLFPSDPFLEEEPLRFLLAGGAGALFAVAVIVLRLYLGWSYVGNRLLSAVVPYEETGWYDGQLWVKPPEVLARDRLLGAYQVKPVMNRLKQTLIGAAALLVTATASLFLLMPSQNNESVAVFTLKKSSPGALAAQQTKVGLRKEDLLNLPVDVLDDDELAAAAAAAAKGRPVYCTDRYYRALAGGQYCKWEDLRE